MTTPPYTAKTEAGQRFVAAARALAPTLRERAAAADSAGEMEAQNYRDLASTGIRGAFVPEELGGMGLESVHDWLLGIAALGEGDASTAIATNMHLGVSRGMAGAWRAAQARGADASRPAAMLSAIADGNMLICATATERGTDNLHPLTEAVADGDGWCINGAKMFVTMSPLATHLGMNVRMRDDSGDHIATTLLPIDTPGVVPQEDWDALGMRASGSQSIHFENVRVPKGALTRLGPWGAWSITSLTNRTLANLPLVGAFLGVAEAAYAITTEALGKQKRVGRPVAEISGIQHGMAEMHIELFRCRATAQYAGTLMDEHLSSVASDPPSLEAAHGIMQAYQSAKWTINRGAIAIVGQAMDLVGGASFMSQHPLARLYRDVRAGPFMSPGAPIEAREYIGRVALGAYPDF